VVFFVVGVVFLVVALRYALTGAPFDEEVTRYLAGVSWNELRTTNPMMASYISFLFREWGVSLLGFSVFLLLASPTAYRRGDRWAWFAFWSVPGLLGFWLALDASVGASGATLAQEAVLLLLALGGLLLPYRRFFARHR